MQMSRETKLYFKLLYSYDGPCFRYYYLHEQKRLYWQHFYYVAVEWEICLLCYQEDNLLQSFTCSCGTFYQIDNSNI